MQRNPVNPFLTPPNCASVFSKEKLKVNVSVTALAKNVHLINYSKRNLQWVIFPLFLYCSWVSLVSKNYEIERTIVQLENEVFQMKQQHGEANKENIRQDFWEDRLIQCGERKAGWAFPDQTLVCEGQHHFMDIILRCLETVKSGPLIFSFYISRIKRFNSVVFFTTKKKKKSQRSKIIWL